MSRNLKILNKEANCVLRAVLQFAEMQDPEATKAEMDEEQILNSIRENLKAIGTAPERVEELMGYEIRHELRFTDRIGLENDIMKKLFDMIGSPSEEREGAIFH